MVLQLGRDAFDRGGGDDEHAPTRPENRHAERLASRIERQTAFGASPQTQIKLNAGVDLAATQGSPGSRDTGHNADRDGRRTILGADRQRDRARCDGSGLKQDWLQVAAVDAQQCDIGGGVTSGKLGRRQSPRREA